MIRTMLTSLLLTYLRLMRGCTLYAKVNDPGSKSDRERRVSLNFALDLAVVTESREWNTEKR